MIAPNRPGASVPFELPTQSLQSLSLTAQSGNREPNQRLQGAVERRNLEGMAIGLDAAIQSVLRDRYNRERELWKILGESRQRVQTSGTPAAYFKRVLTLAQQIDGADFDPLLPFLQLCDELWPYSESVGPYEPPDETAVASTAELLMLAVSQGGMHEYFQPRPEVEQWIAHMADRVLTILRAYVDDRGEGGKHFIPLLLGTAVALHDLVGGLTPYFQRVQDRTRKEYSFVAHVIAGIRRALLSVIVRDFRTAVRVAAGQDVLPSLQGEIRRHRVKPYALPSRAEFQNVRFYLQRLAADQDDLGEVLANLGGIDQLPLLASSLRACPFFNPRKSESRGPERVLPFGQIVLVDCYGEHDEHTFYYTADGVAHETILAHSCPDPARTVDVEIISMLQPADGFTLSAVLSCCVDDRGKVYFGAFDRLAPPAEGADYAEAARKAALVDVACNRALLDEWENYPDLFARLDTLGPLILVHSHQGKFLLCRAECVREIQSLRGWTPRAERETQALLERIRLTSQGSWVSVLLERQREEVPELPESDPRRKWRALIRKRMERHRIPDFRRLVEKLAPFGVEETNLGKGSHGTLRMPEGRKQTTWYALRHKADPLPMPFVWECLERLGIGYQDFYQSLGEE